MGRGATRIGDESNVADMMVWNLGREMRGMFRRLMFKADRRPGHKCGSHAQVTRRDSVPVSTRLACKFSGVM